MTKELTLSIGERLGGLKILNEFKGSLSTLATILDDVKKFNVTSDEWIAAGLTKTPTDEEIKALSDEQKKTASQVWKWNDTEKELKTFTIEQSTADYLAEKIDEKSKAGEITVADVALITLDKKLK